MILKVYFSKEYAQVAQGIEQVTSNHQVVGSNPILGAVFMAASEVIVHPGPSLLQTNIGF